MKPVTLLQNYTLVQRLLREEKERHEETQRLLRATICNNADLHIENAAMAKELKELRTNAQQSVRVDEIPTESLRSAA